MYRWGHSKGTTGPSEQLRVLTNRTVAVTLLPLRLTKNICLAKILTKNIHKLCSE